MARVWRIEGSHPCPWRFKIEWEGRTMLFAGIPNQCETRAEAIIRAVRRLGWLRDGSFSQRYVNS